MITKNIVITGSIAYDYLMSFPGRFREMLLADQLQNVSLSFLVDTLKRQRGGTAPNIAYTLALLGGHPKVMATAGQDFADYRAWLEQFGVDTSAIIEIEGDYTASFFVNTDLEQNQIASFYTGAMAHAAQLTFAQYAADANLAIISPNDPGAMNAYATECKRAGIPYIYDPSQQTIRLSGEELRAGLDGCALLTVNEYEYSLIKERTGLNEADILQKVVGLLVTKGSKGAWLLVDGVEYDIPIVPPHEIVEPTGVGDAFRAALMRGMQLGLPWDVCGRMGAVAATYVLEQLGTQNHYFTPTEFVARYREHFDDNGALDALL
ncbi:MAG: carbohydrate kinase family protein [Ardenticatenaceae bacterium]|nr:carbohydrate kinase family protein [Anaerolineales bacterium]MCB8920454.1 carbohydrate kinase family protein [Ardenticatenaceae bacterium]MCB8989409.1 carbohydrate kinase family protein [Ardenticatenaceae bacterium]MCB9004564.1 carbohydrate kinase family protein [Ardenticatenaceae bacterium]